MWDLLCVLFLAALVFPPLGMALIMLVAWLVEYWWVFILPGGVLWIMFSVGQHRRDY
jgi:hypothetical protein